MVKQLRRFSRLLVATSIALTVLFVCAWARSYWIRDELVHVQEREDRYVISRLGHIRYHRMASWGPEPFRPESKHGFHYNRQDVDLSASSVLSPAMIGDVTYDEVAASEPIVDWGGILYVKSSGEDWSESIVLVLYWLPATLVSLPWGIVVCHSVFQAISQRVGRGHGFPVQALSGGRNAD